MKVTIEQLQRIGQKIEDIRASTTDGDRIATAEA